MATNFLRTNSSSSLSSTGSDNAEVHGRAGKVLQDPAKNKNIMQRTRDALGDIGNRLKKTQQGGGNGKAVLKKDAAPIGFVVPVQRPPRAVAKPRPKEVEKAKTTAKKPESTVAPDYYVTPAETKKESGAGTPTKAVKPGVSRVQTTTENSAVSSVANKENVAIPGGKEDPETEAVVENEYNPRLSAEKAVTTFSLDRLNVVNIDVDEWNPLLVPEYVKEIYDYVFALEKKYPVRIRYLEGRLINSRMRGVLLDWLSEVHTQFGFMPETLYLSAKILDRYLQAERSISRKQLQLVGVTAMYIAAKYEEVCTPAVQDFAAVSDNAFTVADVIKMEQEMLTTLSFDMACPPAVLFLRRFSKAASANMAIHSMAKYIMELSLVDYAACHLFPSEQAAGSLALALLIKEGKSLAEVWTATVQHYTRYDIEAIKPIISTMAGIVSRAQDETHKLKAVHKKYCGKRLNNTSLAPELKVDMWRNRVLNEVCKI